MFATIIIITIILVSITWFAMKILRDKKKTNNVEKVRHEKVVTPTVPRAKYVNDCAFTSDSQSVDLYDDPYDDPYADYHKSDRP